MPGSIWIVRLGRVAWSGWPFVKLPTRLVVDVGNGGVWRHVACGVYVYRKRAGQSGSS